MVTVATPKIFISYSKEHKLWIKSLADEIRAEGDIRGCEPEVIVDQELEFGANIFQFMYDGISSLSDPSGAILFICTPQYKLKADEYLYSRDLELIELRNNVLKAYTWFLKNEIKLNYSLKDAFSSLIDDGIGKEKRAGQTNDILDVYGWFLEKGVGRQDSVERAFLKLIEGGVQRESVMISVFLRYMQEDTTIPDTRRIPILIEGDHKTSIPEDLVASSLVDLRKGEDPGDTNRQKLWNQLLGGEPLDESGDVRVEALFKYDENQIHAQPRLPALKRFTEFSETGQKDGRWYVIRIDPRTGDKAFILFQDPDPDVGVEGFIKALPKKVWEFRYGGVTRAQDVCGAWMDKAAYGQQGTYGWEIDHIIPRSRRGLNAMSNLRPLHWQNNDARGDNLDGYWSCAKTD